MTFECAGNGRALLEPRPVSQPWLTEAVGTAEWAGAALGPLLEEAGVMAGAVEALFTGLDRGVEGGEAQAYERAMPVGEAFGGLLAYEMNGTPLPPQHGFPLRLVVPGWYGMQNVKWLARITLLEEPFEGYQNAVGYRMYDADGNAGEPVTRMLPRSLTVPPGVPDFLTRERHLEPGPVTLEGRAWSGHGPIERVEVSTDGGSSFAEARLGEPLGDARLDRLAVRLGRAARQPRPVLSRHRRRRQRPAARTALEPEGLREQRGRADRGRGGLAALGRQLALDHRGEPLLQALDLAAAALEQLAAGAAGLEPAALGHELLEALDQAGDLGAGLGGNGHASKAPIRRQRPPMRASRGLAAG